jgi:hypothetical protein
MLVTQAQLEDRVGASTLNRVYSDGSDDGTARIDAIDSLRRDGSSKVLGFIGLVYSVDLIEETQAEIVRLTLDVCQAYIAQRHPEFMRGLDGYKMMTQAETELERLRKGLTNLGISGSPEPAANQGGEVLSGDPDNPCPPPQFAINGTDFF